MNEEAITEATELLFSVGMAYIIVRSHSWGCSYDTIR